jgi:hypothetical protein
MYSNQNRRLMDKKQLRDFVLWLREKLAESESVIKVSKVTHNYGKATLFEGKRDAYLDMLKKLNMNQL